MLKKLGGVVALAGLCALSMFLVNCGSSSSRPSGLLYVLTQGTNGVGNNVSSFSIDLGSGNLSFINSNASTCTSTTISCGPPLDIVLDPTGATAFVLNQGVPCVQGVSCVSPCGGANPPCVSIPPTIYPYTINSDGSFSSPGTPIPLSHPLNAQDTQDDASLPVVMTRDAAGKFLFVLNLGSSPEPATCPLEPVPQGNFNSCPFILVYTMTPGSATLTPASGSPFYLSRTPTALSVVTYTPQGASSPQELLFVTSNHDPILRNDNTLSVYSVSSSGTIAELPGSPYTTSTDPLVVQAVNTSSPTGAGGVFVYVGSEPGASGALNIFQVCTLIGVNGCSASDVQNSRLVPVNTKAPPSPGQFPIAMLVDSTNTFLYVACEGSNQVFGYKIGADGTLSTLTPTTSQPTGTRPVAMAIHNSVNSSGAFLYTSNNGSANISGFSLSTTTGTIGNPITVNSPSTPTGMAAR